MKKSLTATKDVVNTKYLAVLKQVATFTDTTVDKPKEERYNLAMSILTTSETSKNQFTLALALTMRVMKDEKLYEVSPEGKFESIQEWAEKSKECRDKHMNFRRTMTNNLVRVGSMLKYDNEKQKIRSVFTHDMEYDFDYMQLLEMSLIKVIDTATNKKTQKIDFAAIQKLIDNGEITSAMPAKEIKGVVKRYLGTDNGVDTEETSSKRVTKKDVEELTATNESLKLATEELTATNNELTAENDKLKAQTARLKKENEKLKAQVNSLLQQLEELKAGKKN